MEGLASLDLPQPSHSCLLSSLLLPGNKDDWWHHFSLHICCVFFYFIIKTKVKTFFLLHLCQKGKIKDQVICCKESRLNIFICGSEIISVHLKGQCPTSFTCFHCKRGLHDKLNLLPCRVSGAFLSQKRGPWVRLSSCCHFCLQLRRDVGPREKAMSVDLGLVI